MFSDIDNKGIREEGWDVTTGADMASGGVDDQDRNDTTGDTICPRTGKAVWEASTTVLRGMKGV